MAWTMSEPSYGVGLPLALPLHLIFFASLDLICSGDKKSLQSLGTLTSAMVVGDGVTRRERLEVRPAARTTALPR